ncbi:MAG: tetratricopeptide repeat protein [Planctomycetota bacterium]
MIRTLSCTLVSITVLSAGFASAQDIPDPEAARRLGIELAGQRKFGEARSCFDRVLRDDPRDAEALRWRAHCNTGLGEFARVIPDLDLVVEIEPNLPWPWYARGMAKRELGRLEDALPDYDAALDRDPNFFKAWEWRGFTNYQLGNPLEAIRDYDGAEPLDPQNPWLYQARARALMQVLDLERAKADFEKASELDPANSEMQQQCGFLAVALGDMDAARQHLVRAVALRQPGEEQWAEMWLHGMFVEEEGEDGGGEAPEEFGDMPSKDADPEVDPFLALWANGVRGDMQPTDIDNLERGLGLGDQDGPERLIRRAEGSFYMGIGHLRSAPKDGESSDKFAALMWLSRCAAIGNPSMPEWHAARELCRRMCDR